jgi:hypothetical protein
MELRFEAQLLSDRKLAICEITAQKFPSNLSEII